MPHSATRMASEFCEHQTVRVAEHGSVAVQNIQPRRSGGSVREGQYPRRTIYALLPAVEQTRFLLTPNQANPPLSAAEDLTRRSSLRTGRPGRTRAVCVWRPLAVLMRLARSLTSAILWEEGAPTRKCRRMSGSTTAMKMRGIYHAARRRTSVRGARRSAAPPLTLQKDWAASRCRKET